MDDLLNGLGAATTGNSANAALNLISQESNPSQAESSAAQLAEDFDTFLLLLTTQLKNQDPTEPLDTNEFTNQIVAFTGVEQSIKTNENLEKLIAMENSSTLATAVNYVGQFVDAVGHAGLLSQDGFASFAYELDTPANKAEIIITDSAGRAVFQGQGPTDAGKQRVLWDGKNSFTGNQEPPGTYHIYVTATDAKGEVMEEGLRTFTTGAVTGAEVINGEVIVNVAGTNVKLSDVLSIRQPIATGGGTTDPDAGNGTDVADETDSTDETGDTSGTDETADDTTGEEVADAA